MVRARQVDIDAGLGWADYADDEYTSVAAYSVTADTDTEIPNNAQTARNTYEPDTISALGGYFLPSHLLVTGISGTFQVGETITGGTSSDTAVITSVNAATGQIFLETITGDFQDAETITGGTSAATATVSGTRVPGKIQSPDGDALNFLIDFKVKPTTASATYIDVWVDIGGSVGELYRRTTSLPKGQNIEHNFTMSVGAYSLDTWAANGAVPYIRASAAVDIYDIRVVATRNYKA